MIDLMPFCLSKTITGREYLHEPFTQGEWTYASNGYVLIRVPQRADVPENKKPNVDKVIRYAGEKQTDMVPLRLMLPAPKTYSCGHCVGIGLKHECPSCRCPCENCEGKGSVAEDMSVAIRGAIFNAIYIRLIQTLPNAKMAAVPAIDSPTWFEFDGGEGLVMPMNGPHSRHIAEPQEAMP